MEFLDGSTALVLRSLTGYPRISGPGDLLVYGLVPNRSLVLLSL